MRDSAGSKKIGYVESSGNVFADLGLPDPELCLAKAEIALEIRHILQDRGLTPEEAGRLMGCDDAGVAAVLEGSLGGYTLDCLVGFLHTLEADEPVAVSPKYPSAERGTLDVMVSG